MIEFDQEKLSLILQINELYHIINLTQQNLTNTIHQVKKRKLFISFFSIIILFFISYQTKINIYKSKSQH